MLIGHEQFMHTLFGTRSCWIKGDLGAYKTAFAYRLAYELLTIKRFGFRHLVSNIPDMWSDNPKNVQVRYEKSEFEDGFDVGLHPYADTVAILDEGGLFVKYSDEVMVLFSALRKLNCLVLVPSKDEPHRTIRTLRVWRQFDWHNFGIDAVTYGWRKTSEDEPITGSFHWLGVSEIFGVYNTEYYPTDAHGIDDWLFDLKNQLTGGGFNERANGGIKTAVTVSSMADRRREDAINDMAGIADDIEAKGQKIIQVLKKRGR